MNHKTLSSTVFVFILIFMMACAVKETPSQKPVEQAQRIEKTERTFTRAAWEVEWEKTVQAAQKEGKVILYSTSAGPALKNAGAVPLLKKKFGIDLEIIAKQGGQLAASLLAERRAGLYMADVLIVGMNSFYGQIEPEGIVEPLEPVLILPEVLDTKNWYGGKLNWANAERTSLNMYAGPNTMIAINTDLVKVEELKSYRDLLNPGWKGKMLMNDPTIAGTGLKSFSALGWALMDMDFLRQLSKQEPVINREWRLQVTWLAQGKYHILLFPHSGAMAEYMQAGAPVSNVLPQEGSYLSTGGGATSLMNRAPHPNAAKVFINWLFSKEGQTLIAPAHGLQSARLDVPTEGLDPLRVRKPGVKYLLGTDSKEWISRDEEYKRVALEIFGHLMK